MSAPIRRLIQITDPHVGPARDYRLAGVETLDTLREVLAEIGASENPPELICATGDIAADGSAEAYRLFTQQLQFLELPYQWLPGNHDDRAALESVFPECCAMQSGRLPFCVRTVCTFVFMFADSLDFFMR